MFFQKIIEKKIENAIEKMGQKESNKNRKQTESYSSKWGKNVQKNHLTISNIYIALEST